MIDIVGELSLEFVPLLLFMESVDFFKCSSQLSGSKKSKGTDKQAYGDHD
jgi:hypothetical protein